MTPLEFLLGILSGLVAGVLSGAFGVGGGIVMTPAISMLLGLPPTVSVETPLPVILPTAAAGARQYMKAGQIDLRAAAWMAVPGAAGSAAGAALTEVVPGRLLLVATAALLAWQGASVARGRRTATHEERPFTGWVFALLGLAAGIVSGLLGIGGGLIMVPAMAGLLGMPLKRALGTSLVAIMALVVPGTIVHAFLGNIDWGVSLALALGAVPGAPVGARLALAARDRTLRLAVGSFLLLVAALYGGRELYLLIKG